MMFCKCKDKPCPTCEAKDQTILIMADELDWLRAQVGASMQSATQVVAPERFRPQTDVDQKLWFDDDEEEVIAQLEAGAIDTQAAEAALARIQAFNTTVTRA